MPQLSVIIPVYNEAGTIRQILEKIAALPIDKEIIAVDDGSTDATGRILRQMNLPCLKVIHHAHNRGKGAAVFTGLNLASAEFIIIQDADLEYDPHDYLRLLEERAKSGADIVLGARFTEGYKGSVIPRLGNRLLTNLLNLLFTAHLNDCFSCYKLFRKETFQRLGLSASGFDIEIEIIAKAIKNGLKIKEVPISYIPRTYKEGKKIRWADGLKAIFSILKYRFSRR